MACRRTIRLVDVSQSGSQTQGVVKRHCTYKLAVGFLYILLGCCLSHSEHLVVVELVVKLGHVARWAWSLWVKSGLLTRRATVHLNKEPKVAYRKHRRPSVRRQTCFSRRGWQLRLVKPTRRCNCQAGCSCIVVLARSSRTQAESLRETKM